MRAMLGKRAMAGKRAMLGERANLYSSVALLLAAAWVASPSTSAAAPRAGASGAQPDGYGISQVALINQHIRQGWQDYEFSPSPTATEAEWCRRVFLDVIGRIPAVHELEAFLQDRSPDKKVRLVNKLLSEEYVEEYARHWTTIWTNVLIGRTGGTERDTLISREGMMQYLRRGFQRNRPYDSMVHELITAAGSNKPGSQDFNGAVNFLVGKYEEKAAQATAKTSQIFLGLQVQCTQCHNHPFNDWKQNQFWELNAFFRQSRPLRSFEGRDIAGVELVDESFAGEGGNPAEAEIYYELRNGLVKVAYPVFVDGTSLVDVHGETTGNSGYLEDVNRRQELSKFVLQSDWMPRAVVNRYWAHFLGYGFTKPIDDMGPHNPPTHPELLNALGKEFRNHSFDLHELIRWITLSEAYSLSSKITAQNKQDDPNLGEKPMFSHFYLRQMQAEQLYDSLLVATSIRNPRSGQLQNMLISGSYEEQLAQKQKWLDQFGIAFGNDEGLEATTFNGTIPQALMMMNGELINRATSGEKGGFLDWVANRSGMSNPEKIRFLFKAGLSREPSSSEIKMGNFFLASRKGDVLAAMQDVWWVLLNTNEFIIIH